MIHEKSQDTKIIESVLAESQVGDLVTYDSLSKAIGRDVRKFAVGSIASARHSLLRDKRFVFGVERGKGLIRLADGQVVEAVQHDRMRVHRTAKRALKKLETVSFSELKESEKKQHIAASAQFGVLAMFANKTSSTRIEKAVESTANNLPIGETLKLFS